MTSNNLKHKTITIQNKNYCYVLCPKCETWIQEKNFKDHYLKKECDMYFRRKDIRRRAEGKAAGRINKCMN